MEGFNTGAVDYVVKPFQQEEVLARVNTHLMLRQLQNQLELTNHDLEERVDQRTEELSDALEEVRKLKKTLEQENHYRSRRSAISTKSWGITPRWFRSFSKLNWSPRPIPLS